MQKNTRTTRLSAFLLALFCATLIAQTGCDLSFEMDPATTVKIEISSISEESDRQSVMDTLGGMTDGNGHVMTSSHDGSSLIVNLSPVSDVEAFSKKINFGEVTEVEGRSIKVKFQE